MSSHFNELIEAFTKAGATLAEAVQMARDQESYERQLRALEREEARKAQQEEVESDRKFQLEQEKLKLEQV